MSKDYIKLKSGEVIYTKDLNHYLPFILIQLYPLHLEICEFIANKYYNFEKESTEWKVLVNFLHKRSKKTKNITSIIILSSFNEVEEIHVSYIDSNFKSFFPSQVKFTSISTTKSFIDSKQVISSIVKYFPNTIFRLLRKRKLPNKKSVIRAWVDVDKVLHSNQWDDSNIFIYPFSINLKRGLKFIRENYKNNKGASIHGVPYSLRLMLSMILKSGINRDTKIITYEVTAMNKHSLDFKGYSNIFTSDEYIPSVNALYEKIQHQTYITNNAHGIGFYNPYVKYDEMIVFNETQRDYYTRRNPKILYKIKSKQHKEKQIIKTSTKHVVIIDQGNLQNYGLHFESALQRKMIDAIYTSCKNHGFKPEIKFHPNRTDNAKHEFLQKYPTFNELTSFIECESYIFFNLYSTAYYDFKKYGSFYFISELMFDPSLLFGSNIKKIKTSEISILIADFISQNETSK